MKYGVVLSAMVTILLACGCIVSDELTTFIIHPDGSADWYQFKSNIRSSDKGEKGFEELSKLMADFDARKGGEFERIVEAGGEVLDARWIHREEPYSTLVTAHFPTASTVEKFWTIKDDKGKVLALAQLKQDCNRRRLSLTIPGPRKSDSEEPKQDSYREIRAHQANGFAESRIIVTGGEITASQGFVVAGDKRSCLIDPPRIEELLRGTTGDLELFLEWEVVKK
ncbi:MAG: hypothetical protein JSS49_00210 [Planctomycetes bacterium]|nr:hypothetical protein [Planctomycetota bacterium]